MEINYTAVWHMGHAAGITVVIGNGWRNKADEGEGVLKSYEIVLIRLISTTKRNIYAR